jgi:hypothetical protein
MELASFPGILSLLTLQNLRMLLSMLNSGKITTRQIKNHFHIRYKAFIDHLDAHSLPHPSISKGRKSIPIDEDIEEEVLELRQFYNLGRDRTRFSISSADINPTSSRQMQKIFVKQHIFHHRKEHDAIEVWRRYVTPYANQLWHADLHNWDVISINGN